MKVCYIPKDKAKKVREFEIDFKKFNNVCYAVTPFYILEEIGMLAPVLLDVALPLSVVGSGICLVYYIYARDEQKRERQLEQDTEYYKLLNEFNKVTLEQEKIKLKSLDTSTGNNQINKVYNSTEIKNMF